MENKVAYYELDPLLTLFLVQSQSCVALTGEVVIKVLKGEAKILGYRVPRKKKIKCNSSKGLPSLVITSFHTPANQKLISSKYIEGLFKKLNVEAEVTFPIALIFLVHHCSPLTKELTYTGPVLFYFKIWQTHIDEIMTEVKDKKQTIMVTGAKNTGKSSFLIHLINTALNNSKDIYCIDTDLGKPLFTLEGTVSLSKIKAPILSNKPKSQSTLRSFLINDTSPKDKPLLYLKAISALYSSYIQLANHRSLLVVNTHGWTDGLGFLLLEQITEVIKPTIIVSLETSITTDRHEYETSLYTKSFIDTNPNIKVIHIDQKDMKLQSQTTEKYKIKNIEQFSLKTCSEQFVSFEDIEFLIPIKDILNKYEILSIFNAQYVGLVKVNKEAKEIRIEDIVVKVWDEEGLLDIEGVGFIANINYNEGIYISIKMFIKSGEKNMKYTVIPLRESIHPKWLIEDPVSYIGMPYNYDTYSTLNFVANRPKLNIK